MELLTHDSSVSGNTGFVKSLSEHLVTKGLLANYMFLESEVVPHDSVENNLRNTSRNAYGNLDAQLLGENSSSAFQKGLGIVYLTGTGHPSYNCVRLRNDSDILNNLTYRVEKEGDLGGGFAFDFWAHDSYGTFNNTQRYRLIMGNENSGGVTGSRPSDAKRSSFVEGEKVHDFSKVHGMIIGFRQKEVGDTTEFVVLPTVSQNDSTGKYGHSICIAEKYSSEPPTRDNAEELGFKVSINKETLLSKYSLSSIEDSFMHIVVSFDYKEDLLSLFLNGEELETSSIAQCFDIPRGVSISTPSFAKKQDPNSIGNEVWDASWNPPTGFVRLFDEDSPESPTPWIIGGGFSDSIRKVYADLEGNSISGFHPGFLGYNTNDLYYGTDASGGLQGQHSTRLGGHFNTCDSGFMGYIGSFKIYGRPLNTPDVLQNYRAQQGFFENIDIS